MRPASNHSRFARNTWTQYVLQIAKYAFPFITVPYLTRILGPDVYAVRAYILAAMTFVQVFLEFGFGPYGIREVARAEGKVGRIQSTLSLVTILRIALCLVGILAICVMGSVVPIMADNHAYVAIAYLTVCFKSLLPDFFFQGIEEMGIITSRYLVSQTIATGLIFVVVKGPMDLLWVPTLEAFAALVALGWSWTNVLGRRGLRFVRVSREGLGPAFREASVFFVSSASTTIFTALTTLMVGVLIEDRAQISYWALAMTAVTAIQSLYSPVVNSLYPHMCVTRDFAFARRVLGFGSIFATMAMIGFAAFHDRIMFILGGREYLAGSYVIVLVSPVLLFSFIAMIIGVPVLAAIGKSKLLTASSVLAASFHVVGLMLLWWAGMFSLPSICVLRCLTEMLLMIIRLVFVRPYLFGGSPRQFDS